MAPPSSAIDKYYHRVLTFAMPLSRFVLFYALESRPLLKHAFSVQERPRLHVSALAGFHGFRLPGGSPGLQRGLAPIVEGPSFPPHAVLRGLAF